VENEKDRRAVQGDCRGGSVEVKLAWGTSCWFRAGCVYVHLTSGKSWKETVGDSVGSSRFSDREASDIGTLAEFILPGTHPEGSRDGERSSSGTSDVPAPTSADGRSCIQCGRTAWRITKGRTNLAFARRRRRRGAGGGDDGGYFGDGGGCGAGRGDGCGGDGYLGFGCGGDSDFGCGSSSGCGSRGCFRTGREGRSTLIPYGEVTRRAALDTCSLE